MTVWDILLLIWLGIVPALLVAAILLNLMLRNLAAHRHELTAKWNRGEF